MFRFLARLGRDAKGATALEYGLILALLVVAVMSGIAALGGGVDGAWGKLSNTVGNAT